MIRAGAGLDKSCLPGKLQVFQANVPTVAPAGARQENSGHRRIRGAQGREWDARVLPGALTNWREVVFQSGLTQGISVRAANCQCQGRRRHAKAVEIESERAFVAGGVARMVSEECPIGRSEGHAQRT